MQASSVICWLRVNFAGAAAFGDPEVTASRAGEPCAQDKRQAVADLSQLSQSGRSSPDCSRTMYSAYQSGQFGSSAPIRFSCWPWAAAARRSAPARSLEELYEVWAGSTRPGSRVLISWISHPIGMAL